MKTNDEVPRIPDLPTETVRDLTVLESVFADALAAAEWKQGERSEERAIVRAWLARYPGEAALLVSAACCHFFNGAYSQPTVSEEEFAALVSAQDYPDI